MTAGMNLLGFYLEEDDDSPTGVRVVLVQPHTEEGTVEHAAERPEELWAAMMAIASDPCLPHAEGEPVAASGDGTVYAFACEQAEAFVSDAAGPMFGRIAGVAMRNHGKDALRFLRFISRNRGKGGTG